MSCLLVSNETQKSDFKHTQDFKWGNPFKSDDGDFISFKQKKYNVLAGVLSVYWSQDLGNRA